MGRPLLLSSCCCSSAATSLPPLFASKDTQSHRVDNCICGRLMSDTAAPSAAAAKKPRAKAAAKEPKVCPPPALVCPTSFSSCQTFNNGVNHLLRHPLPKKQRSSRRKRKMPCLSAAAMMHSKEIWALTAAATRTLRKRSDCTIGLIDADQLPLFAHNSC
jgi:hypothetical protein